TNPPLLRNFLVNTQFLQLQYSGQRSKSFRPEHRRTEVQTALLYLGKSPCRTHSPLSTTSIGRFQQKELFLPRRHLVTDCLSEQSDIPDKFPGGSCRVSEQDPPSEAHLQRLPALHILGYLAMLLNAIRTL